MRTPPDPMIQAGAKALAGDKPARPEHHWDALAVWRAMQAAQWQPIDRAAKSAGDIILAGTRNDVVWVRQGFWDAPDGRWRDAEDFYCDPTHWMPLPEPPADE